MNGVQLQLSQLPADCVGYIVSYLDHSSLRVIAQVSKTIAGIAEKTVTTIYGTDSVSAVSGKINGKIWKLSSFNKYVRLSALFGVIARYDLSAISRKFTSITLMIDAVDDVSELLDVTYGEITIVAENYTGAVHVDVPSVPSVPRVSRDTLSIIQISSLGQSICRLYSMSSGYATLDLVESTFKHIDLSTIGNLSISGAMPSTACNTFKKMSGIKHMNIVNADRGENAIYIRGARDPPSDFPQLEILRLGPWQLTNAIYAGIDTIDVYRDPLTIEGLMELVDNAVPNVKNVGIRGYDKLTDADIGILAKYMDLSEYSMQVAIAHDDISEKRMPFIEFLDYTMKEIQKLSNIPFKRKILFTWMWSIADNNYELDLMFPFEPLERANDLYVARKILAEARQKWMEYRLVGRDPRC